MFDNLTAEEEERVRKIYNEGCNDVRKVLEGLFVKTIVKKPFPKVMQGQDSGNLYFFESAQSRALVLALGHDPGSYEVGELVDAYPMYCNDVELTIKAK